MEYSPSTSSRFLNTNNLVFVLRNLDSKALDFVREPRQKAAGFHILILLIDVFNKREAI